MLLYKKLTYSDDSIYFDRDCYKITIREIWKSNLKFECCEWFSDNLK
jgi:hypothetical protein